MGNEEFSSFPPYSHKRICESGLEWLTAYRDCSGLDGLQVLQAGSQGDIVKPVLAGYPRAANWTEGSRMSRGWQTMEDRKTQQTAKDGHSRRCR
jgi:hypothetical protein